MNQREIERTKAIVIALFLAICLLTCNSCTLDDDWEMASCKDVNDYYDARVEELYADCNIDWKCDRNDEMNALRKERLKALNRLGCK